MVIIYRSKKRETYQIEEISARSRLIRPSSVPAPICLWPNRRDIGAFAPDSCIIRLRPHFVLACFGQNDVYGRSPDQKVKQFTTLPQCVKIAKKNGHNFQKIISERHNQIEDISARSRRIRVQSVSRPHFVLAFFGQNDNVYERSPNPKVKQFTTLLQCVKTALKKWS